MLGPIEAEAGAGAGGVVLRGELGPAGDGPTSSSSSSCVGSSKCVGMLGPIIVKVKLWGWSFRGCSALVISRSLDFGLDHVVRPSSSATPSYKNR